MSGSSEPIPRSQSQGSPKLEIVQSLRGVAALLVLLFHANAFQNAYGASEASRLIARAGASGVDLFFCISGFVMVIATRDPRNHGVGDFIIKRVARVVPPYAVLTLVYVALIAAALSIADANDPNYHFETWQILRSLLFVPLDPFAANEGPWLGGATLHVGWTLNYEMYFYAVFAASLCFGRFRWLVLASWFALTLVVAPLATGRLWLLDAYASYGWSVGYMNLMTSPMMWEFVAGIVIGLIYGSPVSFPGPQSAWLAVCLASSLVIWALADLPSPGFGPLRWGWAYAILLLAVVIASKTVSIRAPALAWVGGISFSLYLVHPLVLEPVFLVARESPDVALALSGPPYVGVMATLSLIAATVSHRWLEVALSDRVRRALDGYARAMSRDDGRHRANANALESRPWT